METEIYQRYVRHMQENYPETYGTMTFDYTKEKWVKATKIKAKPVKHKIKKKVPADVWEHVMMRAGCMCQDCGSTKDLHLHHEQYRINGGEETPENLTVLCYKCHAERHKGEPVYRLMQKALQAI